MYLDIWIVTKTLVLLRFCNLVFYTSINFVGIITINVICCPRLKLNAVKSSNHKEPALSNFEVKHERKLYQFKEVRIIDQS